MSPKKKDEGVRDLSDLDVTVKYENSIKFVRKSAKICGADIFDSNYRVNFVTGLVITCITMYFVFSFYTIKVKMPESWYVILEALCMSGSVCQGISKLCTGIFSQKKLRRLEGIMRNLYEEYSKKGSRNERQQYIKELHKSMDHVKKVIRFVTILYIFLVFSMSLTPIIVLISANKKIFIMQFQIPYLNPDTEFGYYLTITFHGLCLCFGALGNYAGDLFFGMGVLHMRLFKDLIKVKLSLLSNNLKTLGHRKSNKIEADLRDICSFYQKYDIYVNVLNDTYFWIIFVQISSSVFCILLTLFTCFVGSQFLAGYAYLSYCIAVLFLYCVLGTTSTITNDEMCLIFYEFDWENLHIRDQKTIQMLLLRSQNPVEFMVAGLVPLSVETGLQVMKTVYSYLMFLVNFIK